MPLQALTTPLLPLAAGHFLVHGLFTPPARITWRWLLHLALYAAAQAGVMGLILASSPRRWLFVTYVALTQTLIYALFSLIDQAAPSDPPRRRRYRLVGLAVATTLHVVCLALPLLEYQSVFGLPAAHEWLSSLSVAKPAFILLAGLSIAVLHGARFVEIIVEEFVPKPSTGDLIRIPLSPVPGRVIGKIERTIVYLLVITGNISGVGFLAAAKSIFRFGEISEPTQRAEAEYILIGTLASFTWAAGVGWAARYLTQAL